MEKLTVSTARMGIAAFMKTETRSQTGEHEDQIKRVQPARVCMENGALLDMEV